MSAGSRSRWPSVWITVCSAVLVAGCGGSDNRIERQVAERLARQSEAVAVSLERGDACVAAARARALRRAVRGAVAAGQIPTRLQPSLQAAVARLELQIVCTPPPPVVERPAHGEDEDEERGKGKGHGKGKGRRK